MSTTETSTAQPVLHLSHEKSEAPAQGIHNLAMGSQEYVNKRPIFEDKLEERKWLLQHTAAAFRAFGRRDFGIGVAGHISVRDPVDPELFWINPLGKHFSLIKVSDLVQVDKDGNVVGGNTKCVVNAAGFKIHSEIHKARPDVNAACHAHSNYGTAFSTFGRELEMINQDACMFYKAHSVYQNFGGVVLEKEEGERVAKSIGPKGKAVILQNHGLLTVGETIDEAAFLFIAMERCCQNQMLVDSINSTYEKKYIDDDEAAYTFHMTSDPESLYFEFQTEYEYELEMTNGSFLG